MGCFPTADMSRPGEETGPAQVTAGGNNRLASLPSQPRHHTKGLWTHALSLMCTQAGGTREGILIFCLSFSLPPRSAHVFKTGILVFQVITLAKRQQDSPLLGFCYGFNKAFGFFKDYKGPLL
jgi:hypothetical protein